MTDRAYDDDSDLDLPDMGDTEAEDVEGVIDDAPIEMQVFDFARVARIALHQIGADFEDAFSDNKHFCDRGAVRIQ